MRKEYNMKKNTLTVFTPSYNRAHTLGRTYDSLCRQTCKDFEWLIIDDGSIDNTHGLVEQWMLADNGFQIRYVYKENGGLHTGYNKAIELMETELCVCIDSDDWMPDDAVNKILSCWKTLGAEQFAGLIGLDYTLDDRPLGGEFPNIHNCHLYDLTLKYKHTADKKIVIRVDLVKQVAPQPTYNGEKNFNPSYMFYQIDFKYEWLILNENLCYVDYQTDGMASGIYRQYLNSPNSFAAIRINNFNIPTAPFSFYLRQYIHLASSSIISHNYSWLLKAPCPFFSIMALPFGWLLSIYIRYRAKRSS